MPSKVAVSQQLNQHHNVVKHCPRSQTVHPSFSASSPERSEEQKDAMIFASTTSLRNYMTKRHNISTTEKSNNNISIHRQHLISEEERRVFTSPLMMTNNNSTLMLETGS